MKHKEIMLGVIFKTLAMISILSFLTGCAMSVTHSHSEFTPIAVAEPHPLRTITSQFDIKLDTGYSRSLKTGSQWVQVGKVMQGDVYKPYKDVFTLEGAHVHEAYLVVAEGSLVGFYLPVERGFSPLNQKIRLAFN